MTSKTKTAVQIALGTDSKVLSAPDFAKRFYAAEQTRAGLVRQAMATIPHFPEWDKMSDKDVSGIKSGLQVAIIDDWKAKGACDFLKREDGTVVKLNRVKAAKQTYASGDTFTADPVEANSLSAQSLKKLEETDPHRWAAYTALRKDLSTLVSNARVRMVQTANSLKAMDAAEAEGKAARVGRGATVPLNQYVPDWFDGLVKKAKAAEGRKEDCLGHGEVAAMAKRWKAEWQDAIAAKAKRAEEAAKPTTPTKPDAASVTPIGKAKKAKVTKKS